MAHKSCKSQIAVLEMNGQSVPHRWTSMRDGSNTARRQCSAWDAELFATRRAKVLASRESGHRVAHSIDKQSGAIPSSQWKTLRRMYVRPLSYLRALDTSAPQRRGPAATDEQTTTVVHATRNKGMDDSHGSVSVSVFGIGISKYRDFGAVFGISAGPLLRSRISLVTDVGSSLVRPCVVCHPSLVCPRPVSNEGQI